MTGKKPSRDGQRQMILDSDEYHSGEWFTAVEAAGIIGSDRGRARHLLAGMADSGMLVKKMSDAEPGVCGRKTISYCKPPPSLARIPWRFVSNADLGIQESLCGR